MVYRKGAVSELVGNKVSILVAAVLLLTGCSAGSNVNGEAGTKMNNMTAIQSVAVETQSVKKGNLEAQKRLIGDVVPASVVEVVAKVSGELLSINVKNGDLVKNGQVIADIDGKSYTDGLQLDQISLANAKQQLESAIVAKEQAENRLEQVMANLTKVELALSDKQANDETSTSQIDLDLANLQQQWEDATINRERLERLYEDGAVSLQEVEQAEQREQQAEINYEKAQLNAADEQSFEQDEINIENAKIDVASAEKDVEKAAISVEQAKISVQQASTKVGQSERNIQDTVVYAPISGEVKAVNYIVGENVSPQKALLTISDVSNYMVKTQITQEQKNLLTLGKEVKVDRATESEALIAVVTFISSTRNDEGLFEVELHFKGETTNMSGGEVVQLIFTDILVENELLVPTHSIIQKGDNTYVFVVEDGKAARRDVEVLNLQSDLSAITGEVSEGDELIINGHKLVSDGMNVLLPGEELEIMEQDSKEATNPQDQQDENDKSDKDSKEESDDRGGE
ncbi:efflux RND transporter periplasmic adaptor subunit [Cytobacillus sp. IB215316]|nr:efflux RND transporter periplasmic adaptor subunit [Cytobacillus sp. IB215316]